MKTISFTHMVNCMKDKPRRWIVKSYLKKCCCCTLLCILSLGNIIERYPILSTDNNILYNGIVLIIVIVSFSLDSKNGRKNSRISGTLSDLCFTESK